MDLCKNPVNYFGNWLLTGFLQILEGLLTIVVGVASFWMVHDFPDTATFLSVDDRHRVHKRLAADNQASARGESFKIDYFWQSVKDPKTFLGALIYMGVTGKPIAAINR